MRRVSVASREPHGGRGSAWARVQGLLQSREPLVGFGGTGVESYGPHTGTTLHHVGSVCGSVCRWLGTWPCVPS